jgi:hypothetical protein
MTAPASPSAEQRERLELGEKLTAARALAATLPSPDAAAALRVVADEGLRLLSDGRYTVAGVRDHLTEHVEPAVRRLTADVNALREQDATSDTVLEVEAAVRHEDALAGVTHDAEMRWVDRIYEAAPTSGERYSFATRLPREAQAVALKHLALCGLDPSCEPHLRALVGAVPPAPMLERHAHERAERQVRQRQATAALELLGVVGDRKALAERGVLPRRGRDMSRSERAAYWAQHGAFPAW